jgi:NADH-quinone oxidoreductase subunit J
MASAALAAAAAAAPITHTRPGEAAVFYILGALAIVAALGVVFSKNAVHAALALVGVLFTFAVFYAMQDAPFLAAVQIIVYAGAILMLFLFVLMLVGVDSSDSLVETIRGQRIATAVFGTSFVVIMVGAIGHAITHASAVGLTGANAAAGGNVQSLAKLIFTTYFWPFEVISALLIVAAVGAMVLAHRERDDRPSQPELMRERYRREDLVSALGHSASGVFALGDSAARPALLPGGAEDMLSVYPELGGDAPAGGTESTP